MCPLNGEVGIDESKWYLSVIIDGHKNYKESER